MVGKGSFLFSFIIVYNDDGGGVCVDCCENGDVGNDGGGVWNYSDGVGNDGNGIGKWYR